MWDGQEQDYAFAKVFKDTAEWKEVAARVRESLPETSLLRVVRLQNRRLLEEWREYRSSLESSLAADACRHQARSHWGFHGCKSVANARGIARGGFDPIGSGQLGAGGGGMAQYGLGCYFAREAQVALRYGASLEEGMARALAKHGAFCFCFACVCVFCVGTVRVEVLLLDCLKASDCCCFAVMLITLVVAERRWRHATIPDSLLLQGIGS